MNALSQSLRPITTGAEVIALAGIVVAGVTILALVLWLERAGRRRRP